MFVLNDCRQDVRVLREAATLAASGRSVTIVARTTDPYAAAASDPEVRPDGVTILRVPVASGLLRWLLLARQPHRAVAAARTWTTACRRGGPMGWSTVGLAAIVALMASPLLLVAGLALGAGTEVVERVPVARAAWLAVSWRLQWRFSVLPWAAAAAAAAPQATVVHAHDLRALPAADRHRRTCGAALIYDSHEIAVEAGRDGRRPRVARRAMRRREREVAAGMAALVTVNDELAAILGPALRAPRVVVVRNCPPVWTPPDPPPDRLRQALGLPAGTPLALYHGGFMPDRGLVETIAAWRQPALADVHLVLMGAGPLAAEVTRLAAAPAARGRVHVRPPVPPDELPAWVASADVGLMLNQPRSLNERLSTPNKLFECLAVGTPVVSSDFPARRHIILDDPDGPLGAVCDPTDPVAIARAVRDLLDASPAERASRRARIRAAAAARYGWDGQLAVVLAEYGRLTGRPW